MTQHRVLFSIALVFIAQVTLAQKLNQNWEGELTTAIKEFKTCRNTGNLDVSPCSKYIGSSFKTVYGVNDFYSNTRGRYLTGTEIVKFLDADAAWTKLGPAYLQENLDQAQEIANSGKAVMAVYLGDDNLGHVSIILPGELASSGSWGMKVPNSASFFMNIPSKSYMNKALSYAFTRNMIKNVVIYTRK